MRFSSIIVLIALAFTVLAPPSFALTIHGYKAPVLGALDVCHSANPALSSNGDMPCVSESVSFPLPLALNKVVEIVPPPFHPFHIAFQEELPPKQ
jgi:hypothetical protein